MPAAYEGTDIIIRQNCISYYQYVEKLCGNIRKLLVASCKTAKENTKWLYNKSGQIEESDVCLTAYKKTIPETEPFPGFIILSADSILAGANLNCSVIYTYPHGKSGGIKDIFSFR